MKRPLLLVSSISLSVACGGASAPSTLGPAPSATSETSAPVPLASSVRPEASAAPPPSPAKPQAVVQTSLDGPLLRLEPDVRYWYRRADKGGEPDMPLQMVPIVGHPELAHPVSSIDLDSLLLGGAVSVDKDGILVAPATLGEGMAKTTRFARAKVGDHVEVPTSLGKAVVDVEAKERVTVPAGEFEALRVTVKSLSSSHVLWLAPSVGLVRAEWPSHRVDELVRTEKARPLLDPADCAEKLAKPIAFVSAARGFSADCKLGASAGRAVYRGLEEDAARPVWLVVVSSPSELRALADRVGTAAIDAPTQGRSLALAVSTSVDWRKLLE